jgi:folate-dependent phosphoribosylglycinamide formyltransferase PurN
LNEQLSDTGNPEIDDPINDGHRGNLPRVAELVNAHNRSNRMQIELALIVCDDEELMRDFSDLNVPLHQEPSSFPRAWKATGMKREEGESKADFRARKAPLIARAKAEYEQRLLDIMAEHNIDLVISDRYMRIFGPTFLNEYIGLVLNSHPAILPEIPGNIPTSGALERAREQGHNFTGITCHIIDAGEDTGPPVLQEENVPIFPNDTEASLRARNYQNEGDVLFSGIVQHLDNPQARELIRLRRQYVQANGNRKEVLGQMENVRERMLGDHREAFAVFRRNRDSIEPGKYRYSFGAQQAAVRQPLRRVAAAG